MENNKLSREKIAQKAIERLGVARAREASEPMSPPEPNKVGFPGVDALKRGKPPVLTGKFRARIRFTDALSGADTRITLGTFDCAEDAGFAYRAAHIHLWGSLSYFLGEVRL